uniref:Uncharacterized protein n=1 Tax=Rhizophora mucronata TaxID=61149 RepID=A0A2P2QLJ2_RHIMU
MLFSRVSLPVSLPRFSVHNSKLFSLSVEEDRLTRGWTYVLSFSVDDSLSPWEVLDKAWRKLHPPISGVGDACSP